MENYIVRIYQRDNDNLEHVVGTLENVETQRQQPFHSLVSLTRLLSGQDIGKARSNESDLSPLSPLNQTTNIKAG